MQGVNCLQDLKAKLTLAEIEIKQSGGWFINTKHGKWTMAFGVVYLNNSPINNLVNIPKPPRKEKIKPTVKAKTKTKNKTKKK